MRSRGWLQWRTEDGKEAAYEKRKQKSRKPKDLPQRRPNTLSYYTLRCSLCILYWPLPQSPKITPLTTTVLYAHLKNFEPMKRADGREHKKTHLFKVVVERFEQGVNTDREASIIFVFLATLLPYLPWTQTVSVCLISLFKPLCYCFEKVSIQWSLSMVKR